jgi:hypothetical protein
VSAYLANSTHEERSENSRRGAQKRWANTSRVKRKRLMKRLAELPRPNRMIQDRCPCGKFSRALAERRKHKCKAPEEH